MALRAVFRYRCIAAATGSAGPGWARLSKEPQATPQALDADDDWVWVDAKPFELDAQVKECMRLLKVLR